MQKVEICKWSAIICTTSNYAFKDKPIRHILNKYVEVSPAQKIGEFDAHPVLQYFFASPTNHNR